MIDRKSNGERFSGIRPAIFCGTGWRKMIQPVGNGSTPYTNPPRTERKEVPSAGESAPFSLEQALSEQSAAQEGVVYEHGANADSPSAKREARQPRGDAGGAAENASPKNASETSQDKLFGFFERELNLDALLSAAQKFFGNLMTGLSRLLSSFWESKPLSETDSGESGRTAKPGSAVRGAAQDSGLSGSGGEPDAFDQRISELEQTAFGTVGAGSLAGGSSDAEPPEPLAAVQALSGASAGPGPSGRSAPARNTSILTQYNARGRIVTPDASDAQRILHGDRGLKKL